MSPMRTTLLLLALAGMFFTQAVATESDETTAIVAAAQSYMATTFGLTKVAVNVEQVADDFARVKVTPVDPGAPEPAWLFLQKKDGKWTGLTLGNSFTTEDYQQLGIPNALRIP